MRKSKRGEDGGTVPKKSLAVVVITRYLIWPAYVSLLRGIDVADEEIQYKYTAHVDIGKEGLANG